MGTPLLRNFITRRRKRNRGEERLLRPLNLLHVHSIQMLRIGGILQLGTYLGAKLFGKLQVVVIGTAGRNGITVAAVRMLAHKRAAGNHLETQSANKSIQLRQSLLVSTVAINHDYHGRCTVGAKVFHPLQSQGSHMATIYRYRYHRQHIGSKLLLLRRLQSHIYKNGIGNPRTANNRLSYLFRCMGWRKSNQINFSNSHN